MTQLSGATRGAPAVVDRLGAPLHLARGGGPNRFDRQLQLHGLPRLTRRPVEVLQVNLGKVCNQACTHCHVEAGPNRTESMDGRTVDRVLALLAASPSARVLDLTGGAPELNPHFRRLVIAARRLGRHVIDRCNLTVLLEPGQEDLIAFLAEQQVEIVSSLPCYGETNVDRQRGKGVFARSVEALKALNAAGYGAPDGSLVLNLVYNPGGASLPPAQAALEADYRLRLWEDFGLRFHQLFTITNMPIARFAATLARQGGHAAYLDLLEGGFNPATVAPLMCRSQVSVGWDGRLFDCDFNQMLDLDLFAPGLQTPHPNLWQIASLADLPADGVRTGDHCLGCTAGGGSSCGGALDTP